MTFPNYLLLYLKRRLEESRGHGKRQGKPISYSECKLCRRNWGNTFKNKLIQKLLKQPIAAKLCRGGNMP